VTTGAPSSVALAAPPGWAPLLEEPAGLPHVQEALGTGLLVAMLVPAGEVEVAARSLARASAFVLVVDDTRSGAAPVRPADVPALKARLRAERAALPVSCDGPSTICFDLPTEAAAGAERARVATAYVAVAGRLVVVHATAVGTSHEAPRRALAAVTEQLLALDR
jgi:hypothetical protein